MSFEKESEQMLKYGANAFIWIDDWTTEKGNIAIVEAGKTGFDFIESPIRI